MLAITKIAPGAGYRYLVEQVARGNHDFRPAPEGSAVAYYSDPTAQGEAPGWWAGAGADVLGVGGQVTEQHMQRLVGEGAHPLTGERLGQMWRTYLPLTDEDREEAVQRALSNLKGDATVEQKSKVWLDIMTMPERRAVAAYDVTVSPVKSVSLLWAFGDDRVKAAVMAAHHAGIRSALAHLEKHGAFTRTGANGLRQIDSAGLAAMVYDHRMSRDKDPQLHSHIVISSKVRTVAKDGSERWLSLDGRSFYQASVGARAAYERGVEAELQVRLGVRFGLRPGSEIREIIGISLRSIAQYSKRRTTIEREMDDRCTTPGGQREQIPVRRWRRRAQDATLRTRAPKEGAESTRDANRRWRAEDKAAGLDTAADVRQVAAGRVTDVIGGLADKALRRAYGQARRRIDVDESWLHTVVVADLGIDDERRSLIVEAAVRRDPRLALERAVRDLSMERAVFSRGHLELAIGRVLQVDGSVPADWNRVQRLADRAVNGGVGGLRVLTPPALVTWGASLTRDSDRENVYTRHRDLQMTTRSVLAAEQQVIRYAAGRGATAVPTRLLDAVVADMGLMQEKADALRFAASDDRRVIAIVGPAGSGKTYMQRAVALAAERGGVPVIGLTVGQNAAEVLANAIRQGGGPAVRTENIAMWLHAQMMPPDGTTAADWSFRPGQWVIVDEASQASSHDLARLVKLLDPVGGKLIMVGDPAQVSAVGPGGLFRFLSGIGAGVELTDVHRFAAPWEGAASLRLRAGDTTVLAEYDRRGRITGGHREDLIARMIEGWTADILAGEKSLMLVETEAEAAELAARARAVLIRAGQVQPGRGVELANGTRAGVGDLIVTRRNDRRLNAAGKFVANRDEWRVLEVGPDGALQVENTSSGATIALPAGYVAHHVQLGYAATVDSAQGRTVRTARALIDDATARSRLYVMLTRGELLNMAYVVTDDEPREPHLQQPPFAAVAVLADILRRDDTDRSATETEQQLWADVDALHFWGPVFDDLAGQAHAGRAVAVVRSVAGADIATRLAADPALPALNTRLAALQEAGYDPERVLAAVTGARELQSADDVAAVLTWRVDELLDRVTFDPRAATRPDQTRSYVQRAPTVDGDVGHALAQVARICDSRVRGLAEASAQQRPGWTTPLGPVPDDEAGRRQWVARAEIVVAYRDRYQVTGRHPIGPEPRNRDISRWGAWHRARVVLGIGTLAGRVAGADDAQLQAFISRQRAADTAAPEYVGDRLREAHTDLVAAQQQVREIRLELAAVQGEIRSANNRAQAHTPRWWHGAATRGRAAAAAATEQRRAERATQHADVLRAELSRSTATVDGRRTAIDALEGQHRTWTGWYVEALPTRYAGLAAAAERTRRVAVGVTDLAEAVRETTAQVRAIPDTQPRPHGRPVPEYLAEAADAARSRVRGLDPDFDADADPDLGNDLDLDDL